MIKPEVLKGREDLLGTTSPSVLVYAALDGWRRQMVQQGRDLYTAALALAADLRARIEELPGLHVYGREELCGPDLAADLDPLQLVIDVSGLGTSGFRAGDWLRSHRQMDLHVCDHRRVSAQLSHADDATTGERLLRGLRDLVEAAPELRPVPQVAVPDPAGLRLEQVLSPREAFFGRIEQVSAEQAAGRIAAEMLTPYPPGIPAAVPGERLTEPVVEYLRSGLAAGMLIPDAADPTLATVRVSAGGA